jgi:hypothetical protein
MGRSADLENFLIVRRLHFWSRNKKKKDKEEEVRQKNKDKEEEG